MKLSTEIKELRKKEGLTQQDLSEKSGLSIRTIQRIENNEVNPSVYSLRKIGEVLNRDFELKNYSIMKNILEKENRTYLSIVLGLLIISVGGFFYLSNQLENSVDVFDLKIKSHDIKDFDQFDWQSLKNVVRLDTYKEIWVKLIYTKKDTTSLEKIDQFNLQYKLTESNFEEDLKTLKLQFEKLISFEYK